MQPLWRKVNVFSPPRKMAVLRLILRHSQSFIAFSAKSTKSLVISVIHSTFWFVLHAKAKESRREKKSQRLTRNPDP